MAVWGTKVITLPVIDYTKVVARNLGIPSGGGLWSAVYVYVKIVFDPRVAASNRREARLSGYDSMLVQVSRGPVGDDPSLEPTYGGKLLASVIIDPRYHEAEWINIEFANFLSPDAGEDVTVRSGELWINLWAPKNQQGSVLVVASQWTAG